MKILKWELKKSIVHLRFLLAAYAAIIAILCLLLALPVLQEHALFSLVAIFSLLAAAASIYLVLIYPFVSLISDFRSSYYLLERLTPRRFAAALLCKLLLNALSVLAGSGLLLLAAHLANAVTAAHITFVQVYFLNISLRGVPYPMLLLYMAIILPIFSCFCRIVSGSLPLCRKHPSAWAIPLFVAFSFALFWAHQLSQTAEILILCLFSLAAFAGCCYLYEHKYEPTVF